ncbi:hypothetical protein JVX98_31815 (plasmid) [Ensifer sp. PDNC004]|uniref:hypothetical protein n=1 Tax=unclassified Ensifer TaxID=2633371 RepID=UPI001784AFD5|nr:MULTISPECIES: hypothetical protein [unclassified Ensifer]MBD9650272.1 hypothetical protein [Ensifer sp. ENS09]QRY70620.1 hypothetical protein JVX98_31815 [Ensifer sp. PDNC004]
MGIAWRPAQSFSNKIATPLHRQTVIKVASGLAHIAGSVASPDHLLSKKPKQLQSLAGCRQKIPAAKKQTAAAAFAPIEQR